MKRWISLAVLLGLLSTPSHAALCRCLELRQQLEGKSLRIYDHCPSFGRKHHGTDVQLTCAEGHTTSHSSDTLKATCLGGSWKIHSYCEKNCIAPIIPNGSLSIWLRSLSPTNHTNFRSSSSVEVVCNTGFKAYPEKEFATVICKNGEWNAAFQTCIPSGSNNDKQEKKETAVNGATCSCSELYKQLNRKSVQIHRDCEYHSMKNSGSSVQLECAVGHTTSNPPDQLKATCANGSWKVHTSCEKNCAVPTIPNGSVHVWLRRLSPTTEVTLTSNRSVQVVCNEGYEPYPDLEFASVFCRNGEWNRDFQSCLSIQNSAGSLVHDQLSRSVGSCNCEKLKEELKLKSAITNCKSDVSNTPYEVNVECEKDHIQIAGDNVAICTDKGWCTTDILCESETGNLPTQEQQHENLSSVEKDLASSQTNNDNLRSSTGYNIEHTTVKLTEITEQQHGEENEEIDYYDYVQ